jgi:hypothetical protein
MKTETWPSRLGVGHKAEDLAKCKKVIGAKSKQVKTGSNLAESSNEWYGCKRGARGSVVG